MGTATAILVVVIIVYLVLVSHQVQKAHRRKVPPGDRSQADQNK